MADKILKSITFPNLPDKYIIPETTVDAVPTQGSNNAVRSGGVWDKITSLKNDLENSNFNQRIMLPFVSGNKIGNIHGNRGTLDLSNTEYAKSVRSSASPTAKTFGFYFQIEPTTIGANSGHKIYIRIRGLDHSGTQAETKEWALTTASGNTTQGISTIIFTDNSYENIVELNANAGILNLLLRTNSPANEGSYITVESVEWIDLTAMFGIGYEPTIETFKAIYTEDTYDFRYSDVNVDIREVKTLIYPKSGNVVYDVVPNYEGLLLSTADYVLVINNDSQYGNGSSCWFSTRADEDADGYNRNDGSVVYPLANQGAITVHDAPMEKIINIAKGYIGNSNLVYSTRASGTGVGKTLFESGVTDGIDCSAFVCAVLLGITYNNSRYVLGDSSANINGEYVANILSEYTDAIGWGRLNTRRMAMYFAERKMLFTLPTDNGFKATNMLRPGDLLFGSYPDDAEMSRRYYGIGHVMIVLATIPNKSAVLVAQCGGPVDSTVIVNTNDTVGRISLIRLNTANISKYFRVFARPVYWENIIPNHKISKLFSAFVNNERVFDDAQMLPTLYCDSSDGSISYSTLWSGEEKYHDVIPGATIIYTGAISSDRGSLRCKVTEYTKDFEFIKYTALLTTADNLSVELSNNTHYVRFNLGHPAAEGISMTLDECDLFSAKMVLTS